MKLFAWQPKGHGELSWFVMAEDENAARIAVENEMARRINLPFDDNERIYSSDFSGWGTDYYSLTVVDACIPISNNND